jgi:DNA-binding transcriptional MerR regulator
MARASKKSVYERIENKLQNIKEAEEVLAQLNKELQELYTERDNLQMTQLFEAMKTKGLDINEALRLLSNSQEQNDEEEKPKKKVKKEVIEKVVEESKSTEE